MNSLQKHCSICGGTEFGPGPGGRMSFAGVPPCCQDCGALERHRFLRRVWDVFPASFLSQKRAIQFSQDKSVDVGWFADYELSVFGGRNSLDLQSIARDDGVYDIAICNHVLEHVEDDRQAFRELLRILREDGFLQMTVPNPVRRDTTEEWGFADPKLHGHYRHYGIDLIKRFREADRTSHMIYVDSADPVTGTNDFVFFFSKSIRGLENVQTFLKPEFDIMAGDM